MSSVNVSEMTSSEEEFSPAKAAGDDHHSASPVFDHIYLVLPYSVIFLLAVAGNILVIITLVGNKRMRTVTNVFLFNLAISDLLLGVLCMPFTLSGVLLREFVFGNTLCKLIPYFQVQKENHLDNGTKMLKYAIRMKGSDIAVSVTVSSWTLVAMSVERYFAICHPLRSRKWQTLSHAYKMIALVWAGSLLFMAPILLLSRLQNVKGTGKYKCRESWPSETAEKAFTVFLDVILLLIPLVIMSVTYSLIIRTLWRTMDIAAGATTSGQESRYCWKDSTTDISKEENLAASSVPPVASPSKVFTLNIGDGKPMRRSDFDKSLVQKKRVIKMLFAVVLEFFICWTPLYVINTLTLFIPKSVYLVIGYNGISFFQLLAYTSSCCNPVTYCFMNSRFRDSLFRLFPCYKRHSNEQNHRNCALTDGRDGNHAYRVSYMR